MNFWSEINRLELILLTKLLKISLNSTLTGLKSVTKIA